MTILDDIVKRVEDEHGLLKAEDSKRLYENINTTIKHTLQRASGIRDALKVVDAMPTDAAKRCEAFQEAIRVAKAEWQALQDVKDSLKAATFQLREMGGMWNALKIAVANVEENHRMNERAYSRWQSLIDLSKDPGSRRNVAESLAKKAAGYVKNAGTAADEFLATLNELLSGKKLPPLPFDMGPPVRPVPQIRRPMRDLGKRYLLPPGLDGFFPTEEAILNRVMLQKITQSIPLERPIISPTTRKTIGKVVTRVVWVAGVATFVYDIYAFDGTPLQKFVYAGNNLTYIPLTPDFSPLTDIVLQGPTYFKQRMMSSILVKRTALAACVDRWEDQKTDPLIKKWNIRNLHVTCDPQSFLGIDVTRVIKNDKDAADMLAEIQRLDDAYAKAMEDALSKKVPIAEPER